MKRSLWIAPVLPLLVVVVASLCSAEPADLGSRPAALKAESEPLARPAIVISDPSPADGAKRGSLNPTLSVTVRHLAGKPIDIRFCTDASGPWQEIGRFAQAGNGRYSVTPRILVRRGETYRWQVVATDGTATDTQSYSLELVYHFGPGQEVICLADCWKYGYIKRGWEKGRFFVTVQRGMWAEYDLDRGWCKTFQHLLRPKKTGNTGLPGYSFSEGGSLGHSFWGYWGGMYHALGISSGRWLTVDSRTFEGFQKLVQEDAAHDSGAHTQQPAWPEGSTYTFSEDRAWIMANDLKAIRYWEWTKQTGFKPPVTVGTISAPHTGQVALLRHNRSTWYLYTVEGDCSPSNQ